MTRTLFILNRLDVVQATVRALQFRPFLDSAEFALRTPSWAAALEKVWPRRRWLRWPAEAATSWACRRAEAGLARRAAAFEVVYNVGVPSFDLHRRLVRRRRESGFKLVTDLVDAQWLPWFAQFGWERIDEMLAESDAVFTTNRHLAQYARIHNSQVAVIPDSPQVEAFDLQRGQCQAPANEFRVGWIGGRDTVFSLHRIHEALEDVAAACPELHLRVVGAPQDRIPRFEKVRWSSVETYDQAAMVREALQMHVGVFPQFHVEESLCRGALKCKIYMAGEAATVAERLGENEELIDDGRNGLLARSREQWRDALLQLAREPERRQQLAAAGLSLVRSQFTAEAVASRLAAALSRVAAGEALDPPGDGPP